MNFNRLVCFENLKAFVKLLTYKERLSDLSSTQTQMMSLLPVFSI